MRLTLMTDAEEERGSGSCRAGWRGRRRWQMSAVHVGDAVEEMLAVAGA